MAKTTLTFVLAFGLFVSATAFAAGKHHEKLVKQAEIFVHQLAASQFKAAEANFTARMKQAAPPQKLKLIWHQLTGHFGAYQKMGDTRSGSMHGRPVAFVETEFKKKTIWMEVAFDQSGRIAGMHIVSPSLVHKVAGGT
ncbi:MAG TPA: DUF3887 domain-containing protein [Gammaproteobacteria bacterium]|nr:DUF3887 domain-containing protein [Gammaproteobacteria bacterium]